MWEGLVSGVTAKAAGEEIFEESDVPPHKGHDKDMLRLLIALSNLTDTALRGGMIAKCWSSPSPEVGGRKSSKTASTAPKLMLCIRRVVAEKRREFVKYRLQLLVHAYMAPPAQLFEMPDALASPRAVHELDIREAWWWNASGHPDVLRKTEPVSPKAKARGKRTGAAAAVPGTDHGNQKKATKVKRRSSASMPALGDTGAAEKRDSASGGTLLATTPVPGAAGGREEEELHPLMRDDKRPWPAQLHQSRRGRACGKGSKWQWTQILKKADRSAVTYIMRDEPVGVFELEASLGGESMSKLELLSNPSVATEMDLDCSPKSPTTPKSPKRACSTFGAWRRGDFALRTESLLGGWSAEEAAAERSPTSGGGGQREGFAATAPLPLKAAGAGLSLAAAAPQPLRPDDRSTPGVPQRQQRNLAVGNRAPPAAVTSPTMAAADCAGTPLAEAGSRPVRRAASVGLCGNVAAPADPAATSLVAAEPTPASASQPRKIPSALSWGSLIQQPSPSSSTKPLHYQPSRQRVIDTNIDRVLQSTKALSSIRGQIIATANEERSWRTSSMLRGISRPGMAACEKRRIAPRSHDQELLLAEAAKVYPSLEGFASGGQGGLIWWSSVAEGQPACKPSSPTTLTVASEQQPLPPLSSPLQPPSAAKTCRAAEHTYLQEAALRQRVPALPKCLAGFSFDMGHMNLVDDEAAPILTGLKMNENPCDSLILKGNPRLTDVTCVPLLELACSRSAATGVRPSLLDLSGSCGIGVKSLELLAKELRGELWDLRTLRLDGVVVPEPLWVDFSLALQGLCSLESLSLADMQIGRVSQRSAVKVGELLVGVPALRELDLSNNFFSLEGCQVLADHVRSHTRLEKLDVSHNAGGFVASAYAPEGEVAIRAPRKQGKGGRVQLAYNPLLLVCEAVAQARYLKSLSLVQCQLTFDEDFVLENAIQEKSGAELEELRLSENPFQGPQGLRCLMRVAVRHTGLHILEVGEIRKARPPNVSVAYEFTDPGAQYSLDLSHPQHRALLRTLLRRAKEFGGPIDAFFSFKERKLGREVLERWQRNEAFPPKGRLSFVFKTSSPVPQAASCKTETMDAFELIRKTTLARRLQVNLAAFERLSIIFRGITDPETKRLVVTAMSSDMLFKLCHVRCMCELDRWLMPEITNLLMPAVQFVDIMGAFDLLLSSRMSGSPPLHLGSAPTLRLLLFNPLCPDAHYNLNLTVPADRRVLEQVLIIDKWNVSLAESKKCVDLSQNGGHECIRNTVLNGQDLVWKCQERTMPPHGEISFDYCSSFRATGHENISDEDLQGVELALKSALCEPWPKLAALRTVVHKLCMTPEHCARVIRTFPAKPQKEIGEGFQDTFGAVEGYSPRVDALAVVYSRCNSLDGLLSCEEDGLFGGKLLSWEEVIMARRRLGRARTWNILRCDEKQLIPDPPEEVHSEPRKSKKRVTLFDVEASHQQDTALREQLHQRMMGAYRLRDDPTASNSNRYMFDLSLFEDRQCAAALLELSKKEAGEHLDDVSWSEAAHLAERGAMWNLPQDWYNKVPSVGVFGVRYFVERPHYRDVAFRRQLAVKYLGW